MRRIYLISLFTSLTLVALLIGSLPGRVVGQSGRNAVINDQNAVLNVFVHNKKAQSDAPTLNKEQLLLFDGGIQQEIEYFRVDPTGARVLVLIDNSQTLRVDVALVQKAVQAIIKELYEGDQMMIVDYNEQAEILTEFSDNIKNLQTSIAGLKRTGFPKLYDALSACMEDAFRKQLGINKRAIVLISDGYDRESKTKYEAILSTLLTENIVVYAFQAPDRSFGAIRGRDSGPKPVDAIRGLVESTGGQIFKLEKAEELPTIAKTIVDELRDNWFILSYTPKGINPLNNRRLLVTTSQDSVELRTKKLHPGLPPR